MLAKFSKLIILFAILLTAVSVHADNDDPLFVEAETLPPSIDVEAAVKQQLAEFNSLIFDNLKKPENIEFAKQSLNELGILKDYESYLTKLFTMLNAIDPTVKIEDLPRIDAILKEKYGWSSYDLLVEHEKLVENLEKYILPYLEAEAYEREWNLNNPDNNGTFKDKNTDENNVVKKSEAKGDERRDFDYMLNYLNSSEEELLSYKKKWEEQRKVIANYLESRIKDSKGYIYGQTGVWEEKRQEYKGTGTWEEKKEDGSRVFVSGDKVEESRVFVAGEKKEVIESGSYANAKTPLDYAKSTILNLKNGFIIDQLHSVFIYERQLMMADYHLENLDSKVINVQLYRDILLASKNNPERFKQLMKEMGVRDKETWLYQKFNTVEADVEGQLALEYEKAEVNQNSFKVFFKDLPGSSINILLASSVSDTFFTALSQSSITSWAVPKVPGKNKDTYSWNNYRDRQITTYGSIETWVGLLTFLGTTQTVNYAGKYLVQNWDKNWISIRQASKMKFSFVNENAAKVFSKIEGSALFQRVSATKFATRLNTMFKSTMYLEERLASTTFVKGVGFLTKSTFRLVKGFGFFSIGFALGDRFSRAVTTKSMFSNELALAPDDPIRIKTEELLDAMSSGGSWAETGNVMISLFAAEVIFQKASSVPMYYSVMKDLNKSKCGWTFDNLKVAFDKVIQNQKAPTPSTSWFRPKTWSLSLSRTSGVFILQNYINEVILSKFLFKGVITDYKKLVQSQSVQLQMTQMLSLAKEMVENKEINYIEKYLYPEYGKYLFMEDIIAQVKLKKDNVSCCLAYTSKEAIQSKETMSGEQLAFECLVNLFKSIAYPTLTKFTCDYAEFLAKNATQSIVGATPEQQKIIDQGTKKLEILITATQNNDSIIVLIEKADFIKAKQKMNTNEHDPSVVAALSAVIDEVAAGYSNMTVESGLALIKSLFTVSYPKIVGEKSGIEWQFKKDILNALTTVIYNKLKVVGASYTEGKLTGEAYLQSKIYKLLQTVVMLKETNPGHKSSIYETVANLGFTGVRITESGAAEIKIPDNLKTPKKQVPDSNEQTLPDSNKQVIPDMNKKEE